MVLTFTLQNYLKFCRWPTFEISNFLENYEIIIKIPLLQIDILHWRRFNERFLCRILFDNGACLFSIIQLLIRSCVYCCYDLVWLYFFFIYKLCVFPNLLFVVVVVAAVAACFRFSYLFVYVCSGNAKKKVKAKHVSMRFTPFCSDH